MSEEWKAYVNDPRTVCKYGGKCYQKNPDHHEKFKHPPSEAKKLLNKRRFSPYSRESKSPNVKRVQSPKKDINVAAEASKSSDTPSIPSITDSKLNENERNNVPSIVLPDKILFHDNMNIDNKIFKDLFLVEMPPDFRSFFECLQNEENYGRILSNVNLQLIGPFDLLTGKLPILDNKELYLIHWRFFYDPPEFQAVLKTSGKSEYHIGYFRDNPAEAPVFLASNDNAKNCIITPVASNIFAAVYFHLENEKSKSPFTSMACRRLMEKVKKWAEEHKYPIEKFDVNHRLSKCVTKTFHGAGIMVPYNKKTELGYRRLVETDANLKKLFQKFSSATTKADKDKLQAEVQPVITYANIAVDECDFGTGLEIGIDLFCSGIKEMEPSALSCLTSAYSLLDRPAFEKIIQAHLKYRRRGPNMSILSEN